MEIRSEKRMRSKVGRMTTVIAVGFVLCSFAAGSGHAADKGGHDARSGARHSDNRGRGDRGRAVYAQPDNYYAPPANYYAAPEPYYYNDAPQPPPEGINLFFGL